jgi:hypothetical protein
VRTTCSILHSSTHPPFPACLLTSPACLMNEQSHKSC